MKSIKKAIDSIGFVHVVPTSDTEYNNLYAEYLTCSDSMSDVYKTIAQFNRAWLDLSKNVTRILKSTRRGMCEVTVAASGASNASGTGQQQQSRHSLTGDNAGTNSGLSSENSSLMDLTVQPVQDLSAPLRNPELASKIDARLELLEKFTKAQVGRTANPEHVDSPMLRPYQELAEAIQACRALRPMCAAREKKRSELDYKRAELATFEESQRKDQKKELYKEAKTESKNSLKEDKKREKDEKKKDKEAQKWAKLQEELTAAEAKYKEANQETKTKITETIAASRIKLEEMYNVYFSVLTSTASSLVEC